MASPNELDAEGAITKDEIESSTSAPSPAGQGTKRNAFTELMSPKLKVPAAALPPSASASSSSSTMLRPFYNRTSQAKSQDRRDGLGLYADAPEKYPPSRVIFHDADFVAIHDLYPKASVHALLIARSPTLRRLHPFDAFGAATPESAALLAAARVQAQRLKNLVAAELRRRFGEGSKLDAEREAVLNGGGDSGDGDGTDNTQGDRNRDQGGQQQQGGREQEQEQEQEHEGENGADATLPLTPTPPPELPPGRDWEAEVLIGVHLHPSMNDLHVHVISRDMHSSCMKHRKHYNSFQTPFLVPLDDLPLVVAAGAKDPRFDPRGENYLARELKCWRCGENFGNRFARLKEHLEGEFLEWKSE